MRTTIRNEYTLSELAQLAPEAYERVLDRERGRRDYTPWLDETVESLKAVFDAAGVDLVDWQIGESCGHVTIRMDDDAGDLTGPRAMAWLENNLFGPLRIPWTGERRWELARYGRWYRPGMVKPCPFTGYCADDDYLDALREAVAKGDTLAEAFRGLGSVAQRLAEADGEQADDAESICANLDGQYFTIDGDEA